MPSSSIRDVANIAGCSTSTVSRVINNRDAVDPETRAKVLKAIDVLGYKPNLVAQGLRTNRGNLIGLVVPEFSSPSFSETVSCAMDSAFQNGYNIIPVNSHENPNLEEKYIDDLLRRNINGIIFSRVSDESRIVARILEKNIPIVIIDRTLENEKVANVVLDNYQAGVLAAEHLLGLGHRSFACLTGPMKIALCRERLKGFRDTIQRSGGQLPDDSIKEGNFDFPSGQMTTKDLLESGCEFTALWAENDLMAFGAMNTIMISGKRIPEEISVLGMDDLRFCDMVMPKLSSVHYPFDELMDRAVRLIVKEIVEGKIVNEMIVIKPSLTFRESTRRRS